MHGHKNRLAPTVSPVLLVGAFLGIKVKTGVLVIIVLGDGLEIEGEA
jgi:hypothetical protein